MQPGVDAMYPADRLDDALGEADVIFEARPLTRSTRGSLGAVQFARTRPGAILVNVGRAATIDEEALYHHLQEHPEFRAALDVWWDEGFGDGKLGRRFPWTDLPNVTGSPHNSGGVPEADPYSIGKALENVRRFFQGQEPLYLADPSDYAEAGLPPPPAAGDSDGEPR